MGHKRIYQSSKGSQKIQSHASRVAIWPSSYVTLKQSSAFLIFYQVCMCIYKNHAKLKSIATTNFSHTLHVSIAQRNVLPFEQKPRGGELVLSNKLNALKFFRNFTN